MNTLLALVSVTLTVAAGLIGYFAARTFVSRRLRFVDAIHSPLAPVVAGAGAYLIGWPIAWALPLVPTFAAAVFAVGTALGTARGARAASGVGVERQLR